MDYRVVTVDFDAMRKISELARRMKHEGSELMHSGSKKERSVGERIWGSADTIDALLHSCFLPSSADDLSFSGAAQPGSGI